jgi:hypothetical protein
MSGIYLGSGISLRLKPVSGSGLKMSVLEQGKWVARPGRYVLRRDGAFWNAKSPGTSVRLKKAWGRTYLLRRSIGGTGTYYTSLPLGQRVRSATTLTAWSQRVGQKWLLANEHPASLNWESPVLRFTAIPGLRGYLLADGIGSLVPFDAGADPSVGTMFLQVPLAVGRDLNEYEVSAHGGEDMLQFGSIAMRQAATVPALAKGAIVVGSRGFVEWARVDADTTVTLSGQSDWKVFNAEFVLVDSGGSAEVTVALKAGTYVALFGAPGTVISLN